MSLFNSKEIKELFARIERLEKCHRNHDSNFVSYNAKMNNLYKNIQNYLRHIEIKVDNISKENLLIRKIMNDDIDIKKTNTERLRNLTIVNGNNENEMKKIKEDLNQLRTELTNPITNSVTIRHDKTLERLVEEFREFKKKALVIDDKRQTLT